MVKSGHYVYYWNVFFFAHKFGLEGQVITILHDIGSYRSFHTIRQNYVAIEVYVAVKVTDGSVCVPFVVMVPVVMRDVWVRLNSVSSIGVLPFIEGSLGDCTSGLVASSRDSEEHA